MEALQGFKHQGRRCPAQPAHLPPTAALRPASAAAVRSWHQALACGPSRLVSQSKAFRSGFKTQSRQHTFWKVFTPMGAESHPLQGPLCASSHAPVCPASELVEGPHFARRLAQKRPPRRAFQ